MCVSVCVCWKFENYVTAFGKEKAQELLECRNWAATELNFKWRTSCQEEWTEERWGRVGGNGARRCSNTVRVRSGNGQRVPCRARSPLTAAVWLVSVSLPPSFSFSLFEARGLLRVPACLGWWGVGRKGSFLPWPRPEGSNSLANTRKINQQQRRRRKKQLGNNVVNFLSW